MLAPYAKGKKGEFKEDFAELLSKGYMRLRVDGAWVEIGEIESLDPKISHDIDIVVDRLVVNEASKPRIAEAANAALELGKGFFSVYNPDTDEEKLFSQYAYSQKSGLSYGPLQPHDFSFNHPAGMCPVCHGLGIAAEFDLAKIIDPTLSISEDCFQIGSSYQTVRYGNIYDNLARIYKFNVKTPWKDLPEKAKHVLLYGTEKKWTRMHFVHPDSGKKWDEYVRWQGILHEARERLNAAKSDVYRKKMGELMTEMVCPACHGARIKPYPAAAKLGGKKIAEITAMPLSDALVVFRKIGIDSPRNRDRLGAVERDPRAGFNF